MLTTLLYIYLSGWAGFSGYGIYTCHKNGGNHAVSVGFCDAYMVAYVGPLWPKYGYQYLTNESWD